MSCQSSEQTAVSSVGYPVFYSPFWDDRFVRHYVPESKSVLSRTHSIRSSDPIASSVEIEAGAVVLSRSRYTTPVNFVFGSFLSSDGPLRWLDDEWKGSIGHISDTEAAISMINDILPSASQTKTHIFDHMLQELDGMMDYHVFGARVPVSSGELQPWDSKTGLDTTRPLRPNGGPAYRKGVGTHSSKGEASCSSKTSRRRKSRAVKSNVGTNNVDDESQESSNVFAQDSGIGAHNTPNAIASSSLHPTTPPPLSNTHAEFEKMPDHLSPDELTPLPTYTSAGLPNRILGPNHLVVALGHASKRPHCTDTSQSQNIYASWHPPGEQYDPISNLLASRNEIPGFSTTSANTAMHISDFPSLSYGSNSLQDPVPPQVPAYVPNPEGIWFNANMGYGVRQDDEGEASEPQANMVGVNTQPDPEMAMGEGSENVGTSGLTNFYEFVDFSGGF